MLRKKKKRPTRVDKEAVVEEGEDCRPVDEALALQQENSALNDKLMRALADIANMRRRQGEDRIRIVEDTTIRITSELLPILDSFHMAMQTDGSKDEQQQGMQMLESMLSDLLERHGVQRVAAELAAIFDPKVHEAVAVVENAELPAGSIIAVQMEGYCMGERVLRPARVIVSETPEPKELSASDEAESDEVESDKAESDELEGEDHADL